MCKYFYIFFIIILNIRYSMLETRIGNVILDEDVFKVTLCMSYDNFTYYLNPDYGDNRDTLSVFKCVPVSQFEDTFVIYNTNYSIYALINQDGITSFRNISFFNGLIEFHDIDYETYYNKNTRLLFIRLWKIYYGFKRNALRPVCKYEMLIDCNYIINIPKRNYSIDENSNSIIHTLHYKNIIQVCVIIIIIIMCIACFVLLKVLMKIIMKRRENRARIREAYSDQTPADIRQ